MFVACGIWCLADVSSVSCYLSNKGHSFYGESPLDDFANPKFDMR